MNRSYTLLAIVAIIAGCQRTPSGDGRNESVGSSVATNGQNDFVKSSARPWKTYTGDGYRIELPDYFVDLGDGFYRSSDTSERGSIRITTSNIGEDVKALRGRYSGLMHLPQVEGPDEVIDSSSISNSSFRIYFHDADGGYENFFSVLTSKGVFQLDIVYDSSNKSTVEAILPRVFASFHANSKTNRSL